MATIALAEDEDDIRAVIVRLLQRAGHTVVAAVDGMAALAAVREHRPDIIITDIGMPRMNGFELCRAIRADPRLHDIPVMVVSGAILRGDPEAIDAGVTTVVTKPFLPQAFLRQVEDLVVRALDGPATR